MYINNDVSIIACVIVAILGAVAGEITDVLNYFLPKHKKIFSKKNFKEYLNTATPKYLLMVIHIFCYIGILLRYGEGDINTVKYMILTPMIISAFCIDFKHQIIPNRLTLTIFEVGLVFLSLQCISNLNRDISMMQAHNLKESSLLLFHLMNDTISMIQGMFAGSAIFLMITIVGGVIFGKETMGFGDVKMMGALGLYFGFQGIIAVSILAFLIAAIYSIGLLIVQKVRNNEIVEYIAFGPFIVIAAFAVIFIPLDILMVLPYIIFSFGKYKL